MMRLERERRPVNDVGGEPDRLGKLESENDSNTRTESTSPTWTDVVRLLVELRDDIDRGEWQAAPRRRAGIEVGR